MVGYQEYVLICTFFDGLGIKMNIVLNCNFSDNNLTLSASERIMHDIRLYIYARIILKLIYRMMHKV